MSLRNEGLISVIVPVYNAAGSIERTVKCITSQTYGNLEIILVNDGSTDDSLQICRRLQSEDKRIMVIDSANCGQGHARNMGMDAARGEYIGFADADDELEPDMYECLLKMLLENEADLSACLHCDVVDGKLIERRSDAGGTFDREGALKLMAVGQGFKWAVWDKLFRKDKIGAIRFSDEKIRAQDAIFLLKFIESNHRFCYKDLGKYHYFRSNPMSYTRRKWSRANMGLTIFYRGLYDSMVRNHISDRIEVTRKRYYENLLSTYIRCSRAGFSAEGESVLNLIRAEKSGIISAKLLSPLYKIDLIICMKFGKLGPLLNFWYR